MVGLFWRRGGAICNGSLEKKISLFIPLSETDKETYNRRAVEFWLAPTSAFYGSPPWSSRCSIFDDSVGTHCCVLDVDFLTVKSYSAAKVTVLFLFPPSFVFFLLFIQKFHRRSSRNPRPQTLPKVAKRRKRGVDNHPRPRPSHHLANLIPLPWRVAVYGAVLACWFPLTVAAVVEPAASIVGQPRVEVGMMLGVELYHRPDGLLLALDVRHSCFPRHSASSSNLRGAIAVEVEYCRGRYVAFLG